MANRTLTLPGKATREELKYIADCAAKLNMTPANYVRKKLRLDNSVRRGAPSGNKNNPHGRRGAPSASPDRERKPT